MQPIHVVYHVAQMHHWKDTARHQLTLLGSVGLTEVDCTFVGTERDWLTATAAAAGVTLTMVNHDQNVLHYETLAMLRVEHLAKTEGTTRPILYLHTKGVSDPSRTSKEAWRRLMEEHLVRNWKENVAHLADHDAVGVNWWPHDEPHFSGTFWLASPDWIRGLPGFVAYHSGKNFVRYSCEMWIGATPGCRAKSLGCSGEPFWQPGYDFDRWLPPAPGRVNAYHGLRCQKLVSGHEFVRSVVREEPPERVVEVGTGGGGTALFIRHVLNAAGRKHVPVVSVDVEDKGYAALRSAGVDVRVRNYFSPTWRSAHPDLTDLIQGPGKTVLICDGGNKAGEFSALAPHLKPGDLVLVHDYAPDRAAFDRQGIWNSLEFQDKDAAGPALKYGLEPFRAAEARAGVWYCARKVGPTRGAVPVTVCVPTVPPRQAVLLRALDSIAAQTATPEAVLVECDYWRDGGAATRNRLLSRVATPWVAFLDDDDEMLPDHLASLYTFATESGADYVYSYFHVHLNGKPHPAGDPLKSFGVPFNPATPRHTTITTLVRSDLACRVGFKEPRRVPAHGVVHGQDYQFVLDCVAERAVIRHLPKRTWIWHHWENNTSGLPTW